jgi:hypothetical protein
MFLHIASSQCISYFRFRKDLKANTNSRVYIKSISEFLFEPFPRIMKVVTFPLLLYIENAIFLLKALTATTYESFF